MSHEQLSKDAATIWGERLKVDLKQAVKARHQHAVAAIRTLHAAIDNAGALEPGDAARLTTAGATEVSRRALREDQVLAIVQGEASEREKAIALYTRLGQTAQVERLRAELAVIEAYLGS